MTLDLWVSASYTNSLPDRTSPISRMILIVSQACILPMIPAKRPGLPKEDLLPLVFQETNRNRRAHFDN